MAFKGITFAGQNVTPKNDGGLYNAHYGDGILWGCSMNISGDDLVIQSGEFIACGRVCQVDGATNVDLSGRSLTTGYIQVIMNADLSQGEGNQWYTTFVESATTTFPALTTDDINDTGTLYQLELAVVQISGGNLTNITSSVGQSDLHTKGRVILDTPSTLDPRINGYKEGTYVFTINGTTTGATFNAVTSGGARGAGFYCEGDDGRAIVFGDNAEILFRPKGITDSTKQITIDDNAQMHGGRLEYSTTGSSSTLVSAGSTVTLLSISGLPKGLYLVQGYANMNPSTSNVTPFNYGFGLTASNPSYVDCRITSGGVRTRSSMFTIVNVTADNSTIYFTAECTVGGGTITNRTLRVINMG